jgi:hypothetical protein
MTETREQDPGSAQVVCVICEDAKEADDVREWLAGLPGQTLVPIRGRSFDAGTANLIMTGANVLSAVIGGLLAYINAKQGRTIHIKGASGFEVTVPSNTSHEELDRFVKLASDCQANRVILASTGHE